MPTLSGTLSFSHVQHIAPLQYRGGQRVVRNHIFRYSIRQQILNIYLFARGISMKIVYPILPKLHELIFVKLAPFLKKKLLQSFLFSFDSKKLYQNNHWSARDFQPKVSIIVPNYNHADFLRQRLSSIYQQRYSNIEIILLDDASTDGSQDILEEYRKRHPKVTKCAFNKENSGSAFNQWQRGFDLATGDLVWIAESDDYCSENFLEELIKYFVNQAVMLAYCRSVFIEGSSAKPVWSIEEYLAEVDANLWRKPFVMSAHHLVNKAWAIKNIVPNVSSAVFRHPGKLELLGDNIWKQMRICGDWIFYLHLVRGGLIAYTPKAINYYRLHENNTSRNTYSSDIYYHEHELVANELLSLYRVDKDVFERQKQVLQSQWRTFRTDYSEVSFGNCYSFERIRRLAVSRKPNVLMASFALTAGGGETFPIKLANMLKATGYGVTFLNCGRAPTEAGVRGMLRKDIPLLEVDSLEKLETIFDDMGIEIIHSHHGWVDANICHFLKPDSNAKLIVTTHGMYETVPPVELAQVLPLLKKRVSKFVYLSDKNLAPFISHGFDTDGFVRIDNAVDISPIMPVPRSELGVPEDAFLICVVSRAIPEKGWKEGIEAVKLARKISGKDIHLLLIGAGPEYDRLRPVVKDSFIHFLGFRPNTRDYFATSDLGFLPSRFTGESFPLVLIECLHSNRPMLASNVGEIKKMLATGKGTAGTVFNLENQDIPIAGVAETIAAYAEKTDFYLGHLLSVPEAAQKFDPAIMLRRYEKVYLEVFDGTFGSEGNTAEVKKRDRY
ncbi:Glycosyltransferase involved in cell wall bisynthesis [Nitrosospira multiformis]|uniref:Glycosyltransferase involved in cell wall bisynthesis n=2 Tax=Nitrosospira multiformis TaxID=1231 RepID=A0A1H8KB17_9PROT|nr:Glycosyltransferase involved in cell wall bisynthesis [Nitrosospira multiformis]